MEISISLLTTVNAQDGQTVSVVGNTTVITGEQTGGVYAAINRLIPLQGAISTGKPPLA